MLRRDRGVRSAHAEKPNSQNGRFTQSRPTPRPFVLCNSTSAGDEVRETSLGSKATIDVGIQTGLGRRRVAAAKGDDLPQR